MTRQPQEYSVTTLLKGPLIPQPLDSFSAVSQQPHLLPMADTKSPRTPQHAWPKQQERQNREIGRRFKGV